jgi:hypothetical protein
VRAGCPQGLSKDELFTLQMAAWFFDIAQLEYWDDADKGCATLRNLLKEGEEPFIEPILQLLP